MKRIFTVLLAMLFAIPMLIAQAPSIILVTPDDRDDAQYEWLLRQGFDVTKFYPGALSAAGQDTIDMLNAADLIIVGRSPNSGDFDGDDKPAWNNLTAPLIINSQWVARSNRINWFESNNAYHMNLSPALAYGVVSDPSDPIFTYVDLMEGDSVGWCYPPHDFIGNDSATNGEILVSFAGRNPLLVRFDAGVEFYPGSVDMPAGPRTYFGIGNDNLDFDNPNFFPLTKEAKAVYLAEILRLVGEPVAAPVVAPADYRITLITDDDQDDVQYEFLVRQGFDVTKFYPGALSAAGQDTIDMLNAADLIIVGRSPNSGDFDGDDKPAWNNLTAPLIINSQWVARSSRINMFESTSAYHMDDGPAVAYGMVMDPLDPIFDGLTLDGDSLAWCLPPHDFIENNDSASNGEFVAVFNETSPLVVRWDAGVEYYPGAGDIPAGPRTYFGFGNDNAGWVNFFPLTREAKQVYLAEISRMVGLDDVPEVVFDAVDYNITLITDDDQDDEQFNFLAQQGFNVTKFYPGALSAAGQDTIDMLNAADVIIVGRSPNSGDFDGDDKPAWNNLTAPLIINSQWVARSSRINMFESTSAYHMDDGPAVAYGVVSDPADPIFDGLTLDGDSLAWCLPPHDFIENNDSASNGEFVAVFNETSPLVVRWDAGVEYYPGAGDIPAGPRTYFGFGNDNAGWPNFFPLTREAKKVYLAEIARLAGLEEVPEIKYTAADFSAILITDDEEDDPQFNWLRKNGLHVTKFYPGKIGAAGQDTIDMLNAAELIIVGRSPNSGDFQQAPDVEAWNALTTPLILNTQWAARSSRMKMFDSGNAYHMNDGPAVAYAFAEMENDVIFSNVTLEGDSLPFFLPPHDFIENADSANNGDFVAVFNETSPLIVRWEAGVEYYDGAGSTPMGPRTYFGFGNDNVYASNFFPLVEEGQQVYWNEISRMLGADLSIVKVTDTDASLASLEYDVAEAILTPEFDPDVLEYTLDMPEGTPEVRLTANANSENALSVEGDSTIDVSAGEPITTEIVVTAENGGKWFYAVTVVPFGTGIDEPEALENGVLKLYPNPASDRLYLESDKGISHVTILNVIGKVVMNQSVMNHSRVELNIGSLTPGLYMIRVDNGEAVSMAKFLKK